MTQNMISNSDRADGGPYESCVQTVSPPLLCAHRAMRCVPILDLMLLIPRYIFLWRREIVLVDDERIRSPGRTR